MNNLMLITMIRNLSFTFILIVISTNFLFSQMTIEEIKVNPISSERVESSKIENKSDNTFIINKFNANSKLLSKGEYSSIEPELKNGEIEFYYPDSTVQTIGTYSEDMPIGIWIYFDEKGDTLITIDYTKTINFIKNQPKIDDFLILMDNMPEFNHPAYKNFSEYISKNIIYPINSIYNGYEGMVFVSFCIDSEGNLTSIEIVRGVNMEINMEVFRVLSESPKWIPGKHKGTPFNAKYTYPIRFSLK